LDEETFGMNRCRFGKFCCLAAWLMLCPAIADAQQATSLLGQPLESARPDPALLEKLGHHRENYEAEPSADHLIWYGRFQAYCGDYQAAIATFGEGIRQFPDDARMYRHRGHRYITVREFDKALADLDRAVELVRGQTDQVEPDGMPNERNIPVSTLQGNIYYHKGLAHYLKGQWPEALQACRTCQEIGQNDDNRVSTGHWIYSILCRMGRLDEAAASLSDIRPDMDIIENHSYHRACLFYKGLLSEQALMNGLDEGPAGDAIRYARANWLGCRGKTVSGKAALEEIVAGKGWASFGHIAAEADLARMAK
jgi:tetratricopeptide (TPR) repeat protein